MLISLEKFTVYHYILLSQKPFANNKKGNTNEPELTALPIHLCSLLVFFHYQCFFLLYYIKRLYFKTTLLQTLKNNPHQLKAVARMSMSEARSSLGSIAIRFGEGLAGLTKRLEIEPRSSSTRV